MHFVAGGVFAALALLAFVYDLSVVAGWACVVIANVWFATAPRTRIE